LCRSPVRSIPDVRPLPDKWDIVRRRIALGIATECRHFVPLFLVNRRSAYLGEQGYGSCTQYTPRPCEWLRPLDPWKGQSQKTQRQAV
jgi:hypothetical protein